MLIMTPASQEEMLDQSVKCSAPQLAEQPNFVTHLCEVLEDDLALKPEAVDAVANYVWKTPLSWNSRNKFYVTFCPSNWGKLSYY